MTIERIYPSGAWLIAAMIDGHRVARRYFGMTRREAEGEFRNEFGLPRRRA